MRGGCAPLTTTTHKYAVPMPLVPVHLVKEIPRSPSIFADPIDGAWNADMDRYRPVQGGATPELGRPNGGSELRRVVRIVSIRTRHDLTRGGINEYRKEVRWMSRLRIGAPRRVAEHRGGRVYGSRWRNVQQPV